MADHARTWGPVVVVVALLPLAFIGLRACLPPIGGDGAVEAPESVAEPERFEAGSAACAACHQDPHGAWAGSAHALAERSVRPDDPPLPSGHEPVRALGVSPLVQFLVPVDGGRLQVTQDAWDVDRREWFDVFADERAQGEWGHWTGGAMTWNSQCATCHSTGVTKAYDSFSRTYATTADEHGVGCAACHGNAAGHLAGGPGPQVPDDRWLDVCASCHARRAELTGTFDPGDAFLDHFAPTLVDLTDAHWPDGQVRGEDFEYTAFLGSRMHEAGVRCVDCHDPHSAGLKQPAPALCEGCHRSLPGFVDHDPHPEGGPDCVGCHMPVTVYMQRDPRHDHGFLIPDPAIAAEVGVPDVCTRCHADRDPAWAADVARAWWGPLDPARRERALLVQRARDGVEQPLAPLIALLGAERPAHRATAAAALEAYLGDERARAALLGALSDPDGHVRFAAAGALAPAGGLPEVGRALTGLLEDPLRAVRVQASRGVRAAVSPSRLPDYVDYLELNADQPQALHERGSWLLERGRAAEAVKRLRAATEIDPTSPLLRDSLAVALSVFGRPDQAAVELREAVRLAPTDAELAFRLGLAEVGAGRPEAALTALEGAVAMAPDHARAWYNLGLLRSQLGSPDGALAALRRAVDAAPDDAEFRYGLASSLLQQGEQEGARAQAERVLTLAPGHPGARAILGR